MSARHIPYSVLSSPGFYATFTNVQRSSSKTFKAVLYRPKSIPVNPFIVGNPVNNTPMFFGREDVFQFIRQTLIGQHRDNIIVLYGQRRTGKTSVLYQISSHLNERYLCIYMDMHGFTLDGWGGFLWEMTNHILRSLRRNYQIQIPLPKRAEFLTDPRSFFENEVLIQLQAIMGFQ